MLLNLLKYPYYSELLIKVLGGLPGVILRDNLTVKSLTSCYFVSYTFFFFVAFTIISPITESWLFSRSCIRHLNAIIFKDKFISNGPHIDLKHQLQKKFNYQSRFIRATLLLFPFLLRIYIVCQNFSHYFLSVKINASFLHFLICTFLIPYFWSI